MATGVKQSEEEALNQPNTYNLGLPLDNLRLLKSLFGISREDEQRIAGLRSITEGNIEALVEEYFTLLLELPQAKEYFLEEGALENCRASQVHYFESVFGGEYESNYIEGRIKEGCLQHRLALPLTWYIGVYSFLIQNLSKEMAGGADQKEATETVLSLCKMALLDISVTAEARRVYTSTTSQSLSALDASAAINDELAGGQGSESEVVQLIRILTQVAGRIAVVANQLSSSTSQSLATVSQTTATAEEVRQVSEQTSSKAQEISEESRNVASVAKVGQAATEATLEGMVRIREQMESIGECMEQLNNQTKQISEIISTVDDLAQQSNLLAVNASIEAAKAGEQGKGFAVVAQEVKKLSKQSKVATAHVRNILSDVVRAGNDAIVAAERGGRAVDAGYMQATDTGDVIRTLTGSIAKAAEATELIEVASQQQLIGMKQMVQAMEHIKTASELNSTFSVELEKYSRQLTDLGRKILEFTSDKEPNGQGQ